MRHLEDDDNLHYENNSPVSEEELVKARNIAVEVAQRANDLSVQKVNIITSNKTRAEATTSAVARRVSLFVPTDFEVDPRIREIDQGQYMLPLGYQPGDRFQPLQDAWGVFFEETFKEKNLRYRFGDPVIQPDGSAKYPQIAGHFIKFGENQIEFSIRFYSFLSDFCRRFHDTPDILPLVVTHQALVARIVETSYIMDKVKSGSIPSPEPGTFPLLEWGAFQELNQQEDMFVEFGGITSSDLSTTTEFIDILDSEVEYLESLKTRDA